MPSRAAECSTPIRTPAVLGWSVSLIGASHVLIVWDVAIAGMREGKVTRCGGRNRPYPYCSGILQVRSSSII